MGKIITLEHVRSYIEEYDYKLISTIYKSAKSKLHLKCNKGHDCWISWNQFSCLGSRCSECYGNKKLTTEYVASNMLSEGFKLKSDYINNKTKMKIECPNGHEIFKTWRHWHEGSRCEFCKEINKKREPSITDFRVMIVDGKIDVNSYVISGESTQEIQGINQMICEKIKEIADSKTCINSQ